jgi:hypothetical protein
VIVWLLDLHVQLHIQPITTKAVSLNHAHDEVYLTQDYVIKFVSDLWQTGCFLPFPPPIILAATW